MQIRVESTSIWMQQNLHIWILPCLSRERRSLGWNSNNTVLTRKVTTRKCRRFIRQRTTKRTYCTRYRAQRSFSESPRYRLPANIDHASWRRAVWQIVHIFRISSLEPMNLLWLFPVQMCRSLVSEQNTLKMIVVLNLDIKKSSSGKMLTAKVELRVDTH